MQKNNEQVKTNLQNAEASAQKKQGSQDEKQYKKRLKALKKNTKKQDAEQRKRLQRKMAPKNTTEYMGYERMFEDGLCRIEQELYSKSLRFSDINYQTARQDDQLEIFGRYSEVLNFLDPSMYLQLTLVTKKVDEANFRNEMFMPLTEDINGMDDGQDKYRQEMNEMLADKIKEGENSIVREKYFTYATESESRDRATKTIARFESQFASLFKILGVDDMHVLSGEERINLVRSMTRPDDRQSFSLQDIAETGWTSRSFAAPTSLDFSHKEYFEFGKKYGQVLYFGKLSSDLSDRVLSDLSDLPINMVITLHIRNIPQDKALSMVDTKITMMEADNSKRARKAYPLGLPAEAMYLPETVRSLAEAKNLAEDMRNNDQRLFEVTPIVFTYADSLEELAVNANMITLAAQKKTVSVENIEFQQREGFNSILPLGKNHFGRERIRHLTTAVTGMFIPFTTQELFQKYGMYYGLNSISHNLIMFNRRSLPSPNGFILGKPGSGKSFAAKREIVNVLLHDPDADVIIIDLEREYTSLAKGFNGEVIHISADSKCHLNPMDISENYADDGDPISLKSEFILSICDLLAGGLERGQRSIVDRVVSLTYEKFYRKIGGGRTPTLRDFFNILKEQPEEQARSLALALEVYIEGSLGVFSKHTNVDIHKRFVIYDIRDLGMQLRTLGMLIVLDQIWNRITQNRARGRRTYIYIDEIQLLFSNEYSANYFDQLWSRSRKWGAIPTGITQNVERLLLSDKARLMLANCDFILMLNQATSDRRELAELLNISPRQMYYITNVEPGSGLMYASGSMIPFSDKFPKDTEIYKMITTKLDEIKEIEADQAEPTG